MENRASLPPIAHDGMAEYCLSGKMRQKRTYCGAHKLIQSREHRSSETAKHACSQHKTNVPSLFTSPCTNAMVRVSLTEDSRIPLLKANFAVMLANCLLRPPLKPCEHCRCRSRLCIPFGIETQVIATRTQQTVYVAAGSASRSGLKHTTGHVPMYYSPGRSRLCIPFGIPMKIAERGSSCMLCTIFMLLSEAEHHDA